MVDCASIHPSTPLQRACESLQTTHAWHQDIVPEDDTKIQQILRGGVYVCIWVDDWVGRRVERVHRLKGNIRPKMKRGSWKWWVAPSAVTGVNSTVIVLAGRELLTQQPPQSLLDCVEMGQMTSFWQDYPKPGSNLYSTHNTFLQYDKKNKQQKRRPDPAVPRQHRPLCRVDHSWQTVSPQSNVRVKMRFHYSVTLRLFANIKTELFWGSRTLM